MLRTKRLVPSYDSLVATGLAIAVLLWLGLALAVALSLFRDFWNDAPIAASKDLIGPIVTGTGVLIAVLAFLRDRQKIAIDRREARSKILYEQAKSGLEACLELLNDQNNDRIIWVRAARVLASAQHLAKSIDSPEFIEAYRLAEDSVRARLYDALTVKGVEGRRDALPAAFFFGHPDWRTCSLPLDDLAKQTSAQTRIYSYTGQNVIPDNRTMNLSGRSVQVVMSFLHFPQNYADPLDSAECSDPESWADTWGPTQGARQYLLHQQKFIAIGGKLFDKKM